MSARDIFFASLCVTIEKASVDEPFAAIEIRHISVAVDGIALPFHFLVIRNKNKFLRHSHALSTLAVMNDVFSACILKQFCIRLRSARLYQPRYHGRTGDDILEIAASW